MKNSVIQLDKKECYQLLAYIEFCKNEGFIKTKGQYSKRHKRIKQSILHAMSYAGFMEFEEYKKEGGKYILNGKNYN